MRFALFVNNAAVAVLLSIALFFGCSEHPEENNLNDQLFKVRTKTSVTKFIESDEFIAVPRQKEALKRGDISTLSDQEIAKIKAALYRFYSHVELGANGRYIVKISSGEDIRISEEIFYVFKENIDDINDILDDASKSNINYEAPQITKEYLEDLLQSF